MKNIIATVDFSDSSLNAAIYAANIAKFYGVELCLYHAFGMPLPISEIEATVINPVQMKDAVDFEMEKFKSTILEKIGGSLTINLKSEIAIFSIGLEEYCDAIQTNLVVMGLSGKSAFTKLVVGSNTIRTIQKLSYPILVVPPKAQFIPVKKIGFACDYDKPTTAASLEKIKKIVNDFNAGLFVLNVENKSPKPHPTNAESVVNAAFEDLKPSYQTVVSKDITDGINWFAKSNDIDIVIVIPQKHNLIDQLFSRSHTQDLLHHTHLPVLCLHN